MQSNTLPEVARQFIAIFKETCETFKLGLTCQIEDEDETYISIEIDSGQYVLIEEKEVNTESIIGMVKGKCVHYFIQHAEYDPGVRYYPDGSGEPPSTDIVDDCVCTNVYDAVRKVLLLNFENTVGNFLNDMGMEEHYRESEIAEQTYYDEMEEARKINKTSVDYDMFGNEKSHGLGYGR